MFEGLQVSFEKINWVIHVQDLQRVSKIQLWGLGGVSINLSLWIFKQVLLGDFQKFVLEGLPEVSTNTWKGKGKEISKFY